MSTRPDRGHVLAWLWSAIAVAAAVPIAAVLLALAGLRSAAVILVALVAVPVVWHVSTAVVTYRRTMRRPWPQVDPLPFDDDD
jgi:hypothetical protein